LKILIKSQTGTNQKSWKDVKEKPVLDDKDPNYSDGYACAEKYPLKKSHR
jgi:hypothetical protein